MRAEVLAQAAAIDPEKLWIEKVKIATLPSEQAQGGADSREALQELQAILQEAKSDPDFLAHLEEELAPFVNKLSEEVRNDVPLISLAREKRFADLITEVAPGLLARISAKVV